MCNIRDWRRKQVEIYMFDWKEDGTGYASITCKLIKAGAGVNCNSLDLYEIFDNRKPFTFLTVRRYNRKSMEKR